MNSIKVNSLVTEDSVTLYWDRPEGYPKGACYQIYVNQKAAGTTDRTHFELEGLKEQCSYTIQIYLKNGEKEENLSSLSLTTAPKRARIDITAAPYFALGDGKTMNTDAIQRAIDDCRAGESVFIPAGTFLTGALRLHSDMELYLEEGATLQGTDRVEDYLPKIQSRFEGIELECYSSLLNLGELNHNGGYNCENVVIRGKGTIASGGRSLAEKVIATERERLKEDLVSLGDKIREYEKPDTIPGRARPRLINMSNCRNVVLSGVSLKNGASWNVHMIYSDSIVTNGCVFYSEGVWNGDGWDPDSSTNCTIFDCTFYTGDDSIAIKSGKNPEGNRINRPSAHIRIFDCRCAFGHGITIGSEMSGGVKDVSVWDCDMGQSLCGIEIKGTKKRGGYVKNVTVKNCRTARVLFHSVGYNDDGEGAPVPPVFEKCLFEDVHILGEYLGDQREWVPCDAIELCGFEEPGHELRNITFRKICLGRPGAAGKQNISLCLCENIVFDGLSVLK